MRNILNRLFNHKENHEDQHLPPIQVNHNTLKEMLNEIDSSSHPFKPTEFWKELNQKNIEQLNTFGLNNFKRTINQNYFNWIPQGFKDNQIEALTSFWAAHPSTTPFKTEIVAPKLLNSAVSNDQLFDEELADRYAMFVALLWHYTESTDNYGISKILNEPELGNPIKIKYGDKLISQDIANSIRERNTIFDHIHPSLRSGNRIAELGAGYGRLAHVFLSTTDCKYFIFDVPPALLVSQWYLSNLMPEKSIFHFQRFSNYSDVSDSIEKSDICFFTPNQLELFPDDYFNTLISISTLHEMTQTQVASYIDLIQQKTDNLAYLKLWKQSHNPYISKQLEKDSYQFKDDWKVALDRTDPIQDLFFEVIYLNQSN